MSDSQTNLPVPEGYRKRTIRPLYCLVFILPLLLVFHVGAACVGTNLVVPHYFHLVLKYFGAPGAHLSSLLIVLVLLGQHLLGRDSWRLDKWTPAAMLFESVLWTLPLIALGLLIAPGAAQVSPATSMTGDTTRRIIAAFGAGIYEEFFFRMVLISLVMLIFVDVFAMPKAKVALAAVIVTAIFFSLCHLPSEQLLLRAGFDWRKFLFLTAAGLLWAVVFIFRGLAIAVGSHIIYDLYVLAIQ